MKEDKKHIAIYSHGFGVRKDDKGLLTNIADRLPEVESILFGYFDIDEEKKTLTIRPISVQAEMLNEVINKAKKDNPDAIIDLICHSQGTVVAAVAKPQGIRKVILLAPVFDMGIQRTLDRYEKEPDAKIDINGVSVLPPSCGLDRFIPADYWSDRAKLNPIESYNSFSKDTELIVINANQDQVLPKCDTSELSEDIEVINLDGDHNFNSEAREHLIEVIRKKLI